jgi:hypothetical protein
LSDDRGNPGLIDRRAVSYDMSFQTQVFQAGASGRAGFFGLLECADLIRTYAIYDIIIQAGVPGRIAPSGAKI